MKFFKFFRWGSLFLGTLKGKDRGIRVSASGSGVRNASRGRRDAPESLSWSLRAKSRSYGFYCVMRKDPTETVRRNQGSQFSVVAQVLEEISSGEIGLIELYRLLCYVPTRDTRRLCGPAAGFDYTGSEQIHSDGSRLIGDPVRPYCD